MTVSLTTSRRTFMGGALALGATTLLHGCGGGDDSEEIRFLTGGGRWEKGEFGWRQIEAFNDMHQADVRIVSAGQDLPTLFSQQAAAGTFPDMIAGAVNIDLPTMLAHDWALPIDDLGIDITDRFPPQMWVDGVTTADGKVYTWSGDDGRGTYFGYNTAYLEDAGFSQPPTTWDELIEMAGAVKRSHSDVYGLALPLKYEGGFDVLAAMTQPLHPGVELGFDLRTGRYAIDAFYKETMELLIKLKDSGTLHPNSPQLEYADSDGYFNSGRTAFELSGTWICSVNNDRKFTSYAISDAPLPEGAESPLMYGTLALSNYWIMKSSDNQDLAKELVDFLTSAEFIKAQLVDNLSLSSNPSLNQKYAPNDQMKQLLATQRYIVQQPVPETDPTALAALKEEAALPEPRLAARNVAEGVLAGEVTDWQSALEQVNSDYNDRFDEALEKADCPREKFVFDDWDGVSDYPARTSVT